MDIIKDLKLQKVELQKNRIKENKKDYLTVDSLISILLDFSDNEKGDYLITLSAEGGFIRGNIMNEDVYVSKKGDSVIFDLNEFI